MVTAEIIGSRVRRARQSKGLTLRALGEAVGISHVFVGKIEHAKRSVPPARREAFARALGLPVERLTPLDADTLAAVVARLVALGGCDRAVAAVREMIEPEDIHGS